MFQVLFSVDLSNFSHLFLQLQLDGQRPSTREMNRIQELLEEEENFEIINYPTPPHHTNKQGHKKVKYLSFPLNKQASSISYILFVHSYLSFTIFKFKKNAISKRRFSVAFAICERKCCNKITTMKNFKSLLLP